MDAASPSSDTGPSEYVGYLIATKLEPRSNLSEREAMLHIEMDDLLVALDEILAVHVTGRTLLSLAQRLWQPHTSRKRTGSQEKNRQASPSTLSVRQARLWKSPPGRVA